MFETLVEVRRDPAPAWKVWALPLSVALHASVGAALLLHGLYSPVDLVPPLSVFLPAVETVIPVQLGGFARREAPEEPDQTPKSPDRPDPSHLAVPPPEPDPDLDLAQSLPRSGDGPLSGMFGDGPAGPGDPHGTDGGMAPDGPEDNLDRREHGRTLLDNDGGMVKALRLLRRVQPRYPTALLNLGVGGRVEVEIVVDESGRVESVRVLRSSNPLFEEAALAAVRSWVYEPPVSRAGARVAVTARVVVQFSPA